MRLSGVSGRARRAAVVVFIAAGLLAPTVSSSPPAGADPADDVTEAVDDYQAARAEVASTLATLREAESQRDAAAQEHSDATVALDAADQRLAFQRDRYADLSAEYFVRQGAKDTTVNGSMRLALTGRRERLDQAKAAQKAAKKRFETAAKELGKREKTRLRADADHLAAISRADEARDSADTAIADTGARDLPAIAYIAYRDAAARANQADPDCGLPAAVLAGLGRISSGHGRNQGSNPDHLGRVDPPLRGLRGNRLADTDEGAVDGDSGADRAVGPMQLAPATWIASATDGNDDGATNPDDLFDATATTGALLCRGGATLDTAVALDRAVDQLLGDSPQTTVALGVARRYARTEGLDLGEVPPDPRALVSDGTPQFDTSDTTLAPGDVLGMIDWAMTRLGTPYSQCLGIEARPQDPECPPGTNRFGNGFFDCSGFTLSAYRRIGIAIPPSTYAMEADPRFMATMVADRIDLPAMEPGDVFLMDGHTGMYVGGGMIIHAIGVGLTYEPVPGWVANGTFAVLRPSLLL
ncbi:MAG TPA: NlpC/P60 family protein [Acidimicrobiales bacterium]